MHIVLPFLGNLQDPATARPTVALARALARRGHVLHVLCREDAVPGAYLPAAVRHWIDAGPVPIGRDEDEARGLSEGGADAASPLTLELFNPNGNLAVRETALRAFTSEVRADLVLAADGDPGTQVAARLAQELDAPLVLRWDGRVADEVAAHGVALVGRLSAAAQVLVPGEEAEGRLIAALGGTGCPTPVTRVGDGVDVSGLTPPARGAIDPAPCPPLGDSDRCVLFEAEVGGPGTIAETACAIASDLSRYRTHLHTVVAIQEGDGSAPAPSRGHLHLPGPLGHDARQAFRARARLVVLDDAGRAASPRRIHECVATGALPMARGGGGLGDGMADVARELPSDLAEVLVLPAHDSVSADELRARIEFVLDHPDTPYLAPRLTSLAQREFDWSVRAYEYERVLSGLLPHLGAAV